MARDDLTRLRHWALVHKWTSLTCTLFLLVFCITGLPLIFGDELRDLLSDEPPFADLPADTPTANLDRIVAQAKERRPDHHVWFVFVDDDEPKVLVGLLPSAGAEPKTARSLRFDSRTGELLNEIEPTDVRPLTFLDLMLRLHRDLFAGLAGELFLGFIGLVFVVAVVSGGVLYAPFARRQRFGEIRAASRRLWWLDLHNMLGVVTIAWALVVGATGVMNELSQPLFAIWQRTDVAEMLKPYRGQAVPEVTSFSSVQAAFDLAAATMPGRHPTSVVFPNGRIGSPHHYLIWTKGNAALTARLFTPVLVDVVTGKLAAVVEMPWYLRTLQVSRPLHFGDYGGLPLKIIWALLDLVTIVVLGSGLYLWLSRRRSPIETRIREEATLRGNLS
jgi:uncharacterized iron-regulated membrane protein